MRTLAVAASLAFLTSCGATDSTRAERSEELAPEKVDVTPSINACPLFAGSLILPQTIPLGSSAFIAVRAIDPDADDLELTYSWTATSGTFSEPALAVTDYQCDAAGDQSLTVVTRDAGNCDAELHIAVTCLSE